jgi:hypothetical protein
MMQTKMRSLKLFAAAAIFLLLALAVYGLPQPSAEIYGSVFMHGDPGITGLNITAYDSSWIKCGNATVKTLGKYGLISCIGDDLDTTNDEGAAPGEKIIFRINDTPAYVIAGPDDWSAGEYMLIDILGLKNDSPYMHGCQNATILEDSLGSSVIVDLWACSYDRNENVSNLSYSISLGTNDSLIACYILMNRYLTCSDPSQDSSGLVYYNVTTTNSLLLSWSDKVNVTVVPVNDAPYFLQNLTNQSTYDGINFSYKVNCSDVDNSVLHYFDNTSLFDIGPDGLISVVPVQSDIGNHSISIICGDGSINVSQNFTLAIENQFNAPYLFPIGYLQAAESIPFYKVITAFDADNDTLYFSDNTSLFNINSTTGVISFTPTLAQMGNYSINISVTDLMFTVFEIVNFSIRRGPFCGDTSCGGSENCSSCPSDCGICPIPPVVPGQPGAGAGAGTGAGAGAGAGARTSGGRGGLACIENWKCGAWSDCIDGEEQRACKDAKRCGTTAQKPEETRTCGEGVQPDTCFNGIKDGEEAGIDCGGICAKNCEKEIHSWLPIPEIKFPEINIGRHLPWLLILAALIIVSLMISGDQVYIRHIRKTPFNVHKEKANKYRKLRRMLYQSIFMILGITLIAAAYYYKFSNCQPCLIKYLWVPGLAALALPIEIAVMLKAFEYSEYKRDVAERRLKITHELQVRKLERLETKMLLQLEEETFDAIRKYKEENPETELAGFQDILNELVKVHAESLTYKPLSKEILASATNASANEKLVKLSKEHFKIAQLLEDLSMLAKNSAPSDGLIKAERHVMAGMEDVASDKHILSIMMSDDDLTKTYNSIVDVYSAAKGAQKELEKTENEKQNLERQFLPALKQFFEDKELAESKKSDGKWVKIFNLLVDINDHYSKKLSE